LFSIIDFQLSEILKQYGVTRFERQGATLLLVYKDKPIIFSVQKEGFFKTVIGFEKASFIDIKSMTTTLQVKARLYTFASTIRRLLVNK
jgi:hypothetical protein